MDPGEAELNLPDSLASPRNADNDRTRFGIAACTWSGSLSTSATALQLVSAAVRLARAAIELLDLRQHAASHPRLGIVDHISLQPAGLDASLQAAAEAARAIGALVTLAVSHFLCMLKRRKKTSGHSHHSLDGLHLQRPFLQGSSACLRGRPLPRVLTDFRLTKQHLTVLYVRGDAGRRPAAGSGHAVRRGAPAGPRAAGRPTEPRLIPRRLRRHGYCGQPASNPCSLIKSCPRFT